MEGDIRRAAHEAGLTTGDGTLQSMLGDIEVQPFAATNKVPDLDDLGMDRDITYRIFVRTIEVVDPNDPTRKIIAGLGKLVEIDVPADLAGRVYYENLWRAMEPDKSLPSWSKLHEWGVDAMDHVVTDGFSLDAYRIGGDIRPFFQDPTLLPANRVEDFVSTVLMKSEEWWERGARNMASSNEMIRAKGMAEMAEGSRQAYKQYSRYTSAILNDKSLRNLPNVPDNVRQGMDIFGRIDRREMSWPEAQAALSAMGLDVHQVLREFAGHFEAVLKLAPR